MIKGKKKRLNRLRKNIDRWIDDYFIIYILILLYIICMYEWQYLLFIIYNL